MAKNNSIGFAPERLNSFLQYWRDNPRATKAQVAQELGISHGAATRLVNAARSGRLEPLGCPKEPANPPFSPLAGDAPEALAEGARQYLDGSCEFVSKNPITIEDAIRECKIDLKKWRVVRAVVNKWEVAMREPATTVGGAGNNALVVENEKGGRHTLWTRGSNIPLHEPLYQVKLWVEPVPGQDVADALREAIEEIRANPPKFSSAPAPSPTLGIQDPHLLEIDLCDLHFDRLTWGNESGENWDTAISSAIAMQAVRNLLHLAGPFPVTKILYVCGNDFFTADTPGDTTTAGTPQIVDGRWQKTFKQGVKLQIAIIEQLRARAPVDVLVVPGNHDTVKTFCMGCVLEATYSQSKDVRVLNSPAIRKYYRWGTTLLGFCHGHTERHAALPLIMAGEAPADWAQTTHREFHVGHFHHKRETQFHAGNEVGPVRVRILPSLTGTDAWHASKGFVGTQKTIEGYIWSHRRGYVGHLSWGPELRKEADITAA